MSNADTASHKTKFQSFLDEELSKVNGTRHLKEAQRNNQEPLTQKLPNRYRISLHIDDEEIICSSAGQFGFRAYQLNAQDDNWGEKIIEQADHIRKLEHFD